MQSSSNIVNTLLAASNSGKKTSDDPKDEVGQLYKKYLTGDLGDGMSADLNYAIKRLMRGLCSENHAVKQGFFLASC
jgi:hypothetical protein